LYHRPPEIDFDQAEKSIGASETGTPISPRYRCNTVRDFMQRRK